MAKIMDKPERDTKEGSEGEEDENGMKSKYHHLNNVVAPSDDFMEIENPEFSK